MRKLILIFTFICSVYTVSAQLDTDADFKRQVYDNEATGSFFFHTRGYGITFKRQYFIDGYNKQGYEISFLNLRHPKEVQFPIQVSDNSKGFVFGKLNSFFTLRGGYGRDRIIYDKTDKGTVSITAHLFGGASIGLLKPVYLQIERLGDPTDPIIIVEERYNPDEHDLNNIFGGAAFTKGIGETEIQMGVYTKFGISFDYHHKDYRISSLEAGIAFDYFFKEVPIMATRDNPQFGGVENYSLFTTLYVSLNFGKKWN